MPGPPFEEIAGFLNRFAPERVSALKRDFPAEARLLAPGTVMGDSPVGSPVIFRLRAAQEGTLVLRKAVQEALPALRSRLRKARSLKLFLEVTTILSGSVTAASALGAIPMSAVVPSLVTTASALATAARSSLMEAFGDASSTADGLYRGLLEASAEADVLFVELTVAAETSDQEGRGSQLVEQANALLKNARRLLGLAGL